MYRIKGKDKIIIEKTKNNELNIKIFKNFAAKQIKCNLVVSRNLCRVLAIYLEKNEALVNMKLPNGEIERLFNLETLKKQKLDEIGKEFYFKGEDTEKGILFTFEKCYQEYDSEINEALDQLEEHIKNNNEE